MAASRPSTNATDRAGSEVLVESSLSDHAGSRSSTREMSAKDSLRAGALNHQDTGISGVARLRESGESRINSSTGSFKFYDFDSASRR